MELTKNNDGGISSRGIMMKGRLFIVIILSSLMLFIPSVNGIFQPLRTEGGSLSITGETDIVFVAENVVCTIDDGVEATFSASYQFFNPTNHSIQLRIYLPYDEWISSPVITVNQENSMVEEEDFGFSPFSEEDAYKYMSFNATFPSNKITWINATYVTSIGLTHRSFTDVYDTGYISETGATWNNTINVTFSFHINKNVYSFGLSDWMITQDDTYVIASQSFENWLSDRNMDVEWYHLSLNLGGIFILGLIGISGIILFLIWRKNKK